jgi:hypothetical protein
MPFSGSAPAASDAFFQRHWCSRVISEREEGLSSQAQARELDQAVLITQATLCDRVATDDEGPDPCGLPYAAAVTC